MGEKLMAQRVLTLLRTTIAKGSREAEATLDWARENRAWLWPTAVVTDEPAEDSMNWDELGARTCDLVDLQQALPGSETIAAVTDLLKLLEFDRALLEVVVAFQRLPRLASLRGRLGCLGLDTLALLGQLAGAPAADADRRVRRSQALSLGLLSIDREYGGVANLELHWTFAQLLDEASIDENRIVEALAGVRQTAALNRADFVERETELDLLVRLLRGALDARAPGINLLIHGPPGTGKTEFARMLAAEVGASLFAVGEADSDGDEPTRGERLHALNRAQRLLATRGDSLLLFDELEDLLADAGTQFSGSRRVGSKIFVNRLLEKVAVPVIWTSNEIDQVDPAHLRRFSYVLHLGHAGERARVRIAERAAATEGVADAVDGLRPLLRSEADVATVARTALRTAALAGGGSDDAALAGKALLRGLRGGRELLPARDGASLDLSLYEADRCIARTVADLTATSVPLDFSVLLSGPPGTGKTALAEELARRLDRPLAVKRASDLLSKWVGGTEANIASAFAEARNEGAVLLFDEVDSLLIDRAEARMSWEVTQVNELLTWMDSHPLPFIAATNFVRRLDPAAFRRFQFKLELRTLSCAGVERAYRRFFDSPAPAAALEIVGLTPGDFAVVARQLRFCAGGIPANITELLRLEAAAKPGAAAKIGF